MVLFTFKIDKNVIKSYKMIRQIEASDLHVHVISISKVILKEPYNRNVDLIMSPLLKDKKNEMCYNMRPL